MNLVFVLLRFVCVILCSRALPFAAMELLMILVIFVLVMGACIGRMRNQVGTVEDHFSPDSDSDDVRVIDEPVSAKRGEGSGLPTFGEVSQDLPNVPNLPNSPTDRCDQ